MRAYLICQVGRKAGTRVVLAEETFLIGRDAACHLRSKSLDVSSRHCAIISRNGSVVVKDLNSRMGTYVNDRRVQGEFRLGAGDTLRVGPLVFAVQMVPETDAHLGVATAASGESSDSDPALLAMSRVTLPDDADVLLADVPGRPGCITLEDLQEAAQRPAEEDAVTVDASLFPSPIVVYASPLPIDEGKLNVKSA